MRTCSRWYRARKSSASRRIDACNEKSHRSDSTVLAPARFCTSATAAWVLPGSRPTITTWAPIRANSTAASSPMPLVAPVTSTVFPRRSDMGAERNVPSDHTQARQTGAQARGPGRQAGVWPRPEVKKDFGLEPVSGPQVKKEYGPGPVSSPQVKKDFGPEPVSSPQVKKDFGLEPVSGPQVKKEYGPSLFPPSGQETGPPPGGEGGREAGGTRGAGGAGSEAGRRRRAQGQK